MAGIEMREEGDGVWVVTVPGVDIKRDLPDELEERCYELGLMGWVSTARCCMSARATISRRRSRQR